MVSQSFWVEFFESLRYRITSPANRDILTVPLPICIPFISSCLIALGRNSWTMLNRSGDSGYLISFLILGGWFQFRKSIDRYISLRREAL
jgi:hypothetical protein